MEPERMAAGGATSKRSRLPRAGFRLVCRAGSGRILYAPGRPTIWLSDLTNGLLPNRGPQAESGYRPAEGRKPKGSHLPAAGARQCTRLSFLRYSVCRRPATYRSGSQPPGKLNMITIDESRGVFLLSTNSTSYAFRLVEGAIPAHIHWGRRLGAATALAIPDSSRRSFSVQSPVRGGLVDLNACPVEYGYAGSGDFRTPAWEATDAEGYPILEAWYEGHSVSQGKPELDGLPSVRPAAGGEAETLEIVLRDAPSGLAIHLYYTVFPAFDVITRSAVFVNSGKAPIVLSRAASLCVDLPNIGFDMVSLYGAWGREAHISRHPVTFGAHSIGSRRGTSSHHANPFLALAEPSANEHHGEVRAAALVYSGNFLAQVERSSDDQVRLLLGINPDTFSWLLAPGERFATPEALLVYSDCGFNGMSQRFHAIMRERLMRSRFRDQPRPILVNNWEATHFSFTHESLLPIVDAAAGMGIELFVLDDGWFGARDDDRTSLGDWSENLRKLPRGVEGLAAEVARRRLRFGLWFEPEMVSPDSELFRAHPDWCLHIPGREKPIGRNQLVLDFSRPEVCEEIVRRVCAVLDSAPIAYVKWDMNRYLTHVASPSLPPERRGETAHRYVLGLYRVMEEITSRHPDILFAGCSGGGGRFDAGILSYMPQIWGSRRSPADTVWLKPRLSHLGDRGSRHRRSQPSGWAGDAVRDARCGSDVR